MANDIQIYFDMDGVLANFDLGVVEMCHLPAREQGHTTKEQDKELWGRVREHNHFYAGLAPIPGSIEFVKRIHDIYGDQCQILTGVPRPEKNVPYAAEDKINWMVWNVSPDIKVNIVLRKEKVQFCKDKSSILIDDYWKNIAEWKDAGGTGILFRNVEQTKAELKMVLLGMDHIITY